MPFLIGNVGILDSDGNRVDQPDENGDHSPFMLKIGTSMSAESTQNGSINEILLEATGGGGGGGGTTIALANHAAFRSLAVAPDDGTVINFKSPPGQYVYFSSDGTGFADDDNTILKRTATLVGSPGRAYPVGASAVVPTIAALRLAVSGKIPAIHVQAYSSFDDGGGGLFDNIAGTAVDDGGIIIQPAGAGFHYQRRFSGGVEVQWFGAKGDGATDDRAAIQAAILYAYVKRYPVAVSGPAPDVRYTAPRVRLPGGKVWVIGRLGTFPHGLELPGTVHLVGDRGTVFIPRTVAVAVDATTDTFTHANHGFAVGEQVLISAPQGTMPGAVKDGELYYVIASGFSSSAFKISLTLGGSAVNVTSNGTAVFAAVAHATICLEIARSHVEGIQFLGGVHAFALGGATSYLGTINAFFSAEYGGNIVNCQFINQAGPSVWQNMSPISFPANYRTTGPIKFTRCLFRGPSFWWGLSDKLDFSHCTFIWDQNQIIADQDAGLPSLLHSGDGLTLGAVNIADNVFFDHCFIDPLGSNAGKKWPERNTFGVGGGNVNFLNTIWGELGGCLWRQRYTANTYTGIGEAPASFAGASGSPPLKLTVEGACLFDVFTKNLIEVYEQPIGVLRLGRGDETNMGGNFGAWVDSGVSIASMLQTTQSGQILEYDYVTGPVTRWRQSTEGNGFASVGGQPWGNPILSGTGIVDITGIFEAFWHHRPHDEFHVNATPQDNLFLPGLYKPVNGGNPAIDVTIPLAINFVSGGTDSSTGYTLPTFTSGAAGGAIGFGTPPWGAALPAGVYCFSVDILSTADIFCVFQYTYAGHQSQVATRKVTGGVGGYQRYEFSFYFPGGGATYSFQSGSDSLPAAITVSFGRFKIEKGRKSTAYTFPVDNAATPTTNITSQRDPAVYFMTTVPTTGTFIVGDRVINSDPAPGEFEEAVCTTGNVGGGTAAWRISSTVAPAGTGLVQQDATGLFSLASTSGVVGTMGGDVTGTTAASTVVGLTGTANVVAMHGTVLQWDTTVVPTIKAADVTANSGTGPLLSILGANETGTGGTGGALAVKAGSATGASGTRTGGDLTLSSGTGANGDGSVIVQTGTGASSSGTITVRVTGSKYFTINTSIAQIGHTALYFDVDGINFRKSDGTAKGNWNNTGLRIGDATGATEKLDVAGNIKIDAAVSNPQIFQPQAASGSGQSLSIVAQSSVASGNVNGGSINLATGAGNGTGVPGQVRIQPGAVTSANFSSTGLRVGDGTAATEKLEVAGTGLFTGELKLGSAFLSFQSNATNPTISHLSQTGTNGDVFSILAQDGNGTNKNGGLMEILGGAPTGTGDAGAVYIGTKDSVGNIFPMIQAATISGQHVVAIGKETSLTSTDYASTVGDRTLYIADATGIGTGVMPANGIVLYSFAGSPTWKGSNGGKTVCWTSNTSDTATGGIDILPAAPAKFLSLTVDGTLYKLPMYLP